MVGNVVHLKAQLEERLLVNVAHLPLRLSNVVLEGHERLEDADARDGARPRAAS